MEYEKIKQLMEDMSNSKLSQLEVEFPEGLKISMKKDELDTSNSKVYIKEMNEEIAKDSIKISKTDEKKGNIIKSPMVGKFYLKPSPSADPYVEIGKDIKKGDVLCIVEAMKLMNEIESDYTGKIKEILVKDGSPVEYGTELFVIE